MKDLTYEKSLEAAKPVKEMAELARTLDVEYLTDALNAMKENHSFRDSAMILNPNPHTAIEQQELNAAKIEGLELMLKLAKNQEKILSLTVKLEGAKRNSQELAKMFGL